MKDGTRFEVRGIASVVLSILYLLVCCVIGAFSCYALSCQCDCFASLPAALPRDLISLTNTLHLCYSRRQSSRNSDNHRLVSMDSLDLQATDSTSNYVRIAVLSHFGSEPLYVHTFYN